MIVWWRNNWLVHIIWIFLSISYTEIPLGCWPVFGIGVEGCVDFTAVDIFVVLFEVSIVIWSFYIVSFLVWSRAYFLTAILTELFSVLETRWPRYARPLSVKVTRHNRMGITPLQAGYHAMTPRPLRVLWTQFVTTCVCFANVVSRLHYDHHA